MDFKNLIRNGEKMNKIPKTKFKALLANNESVLIDRIWNLSKERFDMLINNIENLEEVKYLEENVRKCAKVNSNSLQFSNGSMLYFDNPSKCYTFSNNLAIMVEKKLCTIDKVDKYHTIIYLIV